ncbi:hypothetical protein SAMN02927900_04228 [Rhizobium mongolense subsp. loessense]|uniref:Uncharacterized protein n=1 Tax=Rhizobium mongolense subsp. loessense TaxID=158890 RepID=A0A1G4SV60_9HYPH|nr:hypothetical protein [Rhizobium mongolense]SCW72956.1 hypothetical protein SAMN02927900_04228 [Rhizobium mongolense subsp. loessense]
MNIRPHYYARRDGDGSWSIVNTQTQKVAVIAEILPLRRLDESTAMEIIDALRERHSASGEPGASADSTTARGHDGLSRFN